MVVGNNGTQLKPNVFDMPKTTKNNLVTKFYSQNSGDISSGFVNVLSTP